MLAMASPSRMGVLAMAGPGRANGFQTVARGESDLDSAAWETLHDSLEVQCPVGLIDIPGP